MWYFCQEYVGRFDLFNLLQSDQSLYNNESKKLLQVEDLNWNDFYWDREDIWEGKDLDKFLEG